MTIASSATVTDEALRSLTCTFISNPLIVELTFDDTREVRHSQASHTDCDTHCRVRYVETFSSAMRFTKGYTCPAMHTVMFSDAS
ncbi:hypothetical protein GCM10009855_22300 [Gordonia cholesterolivorans]|uniref:Uncharacterized protein n=1 Tax=Gordonia cholesterolivorans TaxID=559625 RepID=A0ABP5UJ22_9ACTN